MLRRMMKQQTAVEFLLAPLCKVLVVDDDEGDLEYHSELLKGQGHIVVPCNSYSLAAELLEKNVYDLAILSQGTPAFEGREVLERMRSAHCSTPVLVVARAKELGCYLEAMRLGAVDYIEKPVRPAEIRRILRTRFQPSLS
ncbi:MAG: response regulator [Acidobacteriota bacterium]|nr:response regulator [Acidobacteriota bacterium]